MATVHLLHHDRSIDLDDGAALRQLADIDRRLLPFGCYAGHCATCMIEVVEGAEHLSPINATEEYTLTRDEIARGIRLACQITVCEGTVHIRPAR